MEEFLYLLLQELKNELIDIDMLAKLQGFWGKQKIVRRFLTDLGKCQYCGDYPVNKDEDFLTIKVDVPVTKNVLCVSTIIQGYFSESTHQMILRCGNCCNHTSCAQTGPCMPKAAVTDTSLTVSPDYFIIQLNRFAASAAINCVPNVPC